MTKTSYTTSFAGRRLMIPHEVIQHTEKNLLLTVIFAYLQSNRSFRGVIRTSKLELCEGCGYCYKPNDNGQKLLDEICDALNLLFELGYIECFLDKKNYNQYTSIAEIPDLNIVSTFNIRLSDKCLSCDDRFMLLPLEDYDKIYEMRYMYRAPFMRNALNVFCYMMSSSAGTRLENEDWVGFFYQAADTMIRHIPGVKSRTTLNKLLQTLLDQQLLCATTLPNLRLDNGTIIQGARIFVHYTPNADKALAIAMKAAIETRKKYYIKQGLLTE